MRYAKFFFILAAFLTLMIAPSATTPTAFASGTWNGQDTFHVPISWCAVTGSPAQANPNIAGDTDTDAILWRRHERPTDNIYVNPSGITFRSAINNAWGTFNFPVLADPDTTLGTQGDMRGEDVNTFGVEFNTLINNCDQEYNNLGRAGIGITAVNAGLFHDAAGNYVGVIGWGGCAEIGGNCAIPFDGRIAVIDNQYLHPTSTDRTFPPSPVDPGGNLQFTITDPIDVLTGHEFGHALSLNHVNNVLSLMNPGVTDNSGDGTADNVNLSAAEVTALRTNAQNVPGLETDPQGQFNPGTFVANRQPDAVQEVGELPAYLDLASVRASLDKDRDILYLEQQLFGLLPAEGEAVSFAYLLDVDGPETGFTPEQLRRMRMGEAQVAAGFDVIGLATVRSGQVSGRVFVLRDGELVTLDRGFNFALLTMIVHPQFAPLSGAGGVLPKDIDYPLHHIVRLELENAIPGIRLDQPFQLQTLILSQNRVTDRLDDDPRGRGFVLENPSFPHCRPLEDGTRGATAQVAFDGLLPDAPIHALIGPTLVATGTSDAAGAGTIGMPIPADAAAGYHLVTIGVDGTALTADCVINVVVRPVPGGRIPPDVFALLTSHEDLLRRQSQLLELLGHLIQDMTDVPQDRRLALVERYEDLLRRQQELLAMFAEMVTRAVGE